MPRKSKSSTPALSVEDAASLTDLEYRLLDWCAFNQYTQHNGAEPDNHQSVHVWFWPDDIAAELGITERGVGGVVSSLIKKGLVTVSPNGARAGEASDAGIAFTEAGFVAWQELFKAVGRPEHLATEPDVVHATDEEIDEVLGNVTPVAGGFQYLTRDALKALAETDPAARAAYRMERRKVARAARKARKAS